MIVKALAKEAQDMPFFIVKPRDIFNEYLGGTEKRIKILFQVLEAHSPCILFLDDAEQMLADRGRFHKKKFAPYALLLRSFL